MRHCLTAKGLKDLLLYYLFDTNLHHIEAKVSKFLDICFPLIQAHMHNGLESVQDIYMYNIWCIYH